MTMSGVTPTSAWRWCAWWPETKRYTEFLQLLSSQKQRRMLQTGMRRFLYPFLLACLLPACVMAQSVSVVAEGLIVQLKATSAEGSTRELPSVQRAQRESLAQERMQSIKQGAGVANFAHRQISADHRLMRFATPLHGQALEDTMRRLRLHPDIASVEPNVRMKRAQAPNDARFTEQWHLGSRAVNAAALNMTQTWALTTGSSAAVVAVVDTGILQHPDLAGKVLPGYDFIEDVENANDGSGRDSDPTDPGDWVSASEAASVGAFTSCQAEDSSWHGTFIAGQIAAVTNNSVGVAGLNWNAKILPVRVSGKCGALLSDILDGIRWAAGLPVEGVPTNTNPAKVINLSFGGDRACSSSYQTVIDEITAAGSLLVVAAGNSQGFGDDLQLRRPADCQGVLAVGALQADGLKTSYSRVGSSMALMAPGGHGDSTSTSLLSLDNAGLRGPTALDAYGYKVGTSFSAPLAAGVASLMLATNPALTPDALIDRMKSSAMAFVAGASSCSSNLRVACACTTALCGAGMLNPLAAVQASFAPAAVIAQVTSFEPGSVVTLDGRNSAGVGTATISRYAWSVAQGTGLSIESPTAALTQVRLPAEPGDFVVKLIVTDSLGQTGQTQLRINTLPAPAQTPDTSESSGGGGGADTHWWALALLLLACATLCSGRWFKAAKQEIKN